MGLDSVNPTRCRRFGGHRTFAGKVRDVSPIMESSGRRQIITYHTRYVANLGIVLHCVVSFWSMHSAPNEISNARYSAELFFIVEWNM